MDFVQADNFSSGTFHTQLLGLFDNIPNTTDSTNIYIQSRAMFKMAILLSRQYNVTIDGEYIGYQIMETNGSAIDAIIKSCRVLSNSNIVGIVGPGLSREARLIADLGKVVGIPVVSSSATNPDLSDDNILPNFFRTVPSDNIAAFALMKLFYHFDWHSCIFIYQNDAFGLGAANKINALFDMNNITVEKTIQFDINTLRIRSDLTQLSKTSVARIVVLWAQSNYIPIILNEALRSNVLGPLFTWILSSSVSLKYFNKTSYDKLIGLITLEPVTADVVNASINRTLLRAAYKLWQQYEPESFPGKGNVNFYALFAFDATWLSILSLNRICSTLRNISSSCLSYIESSFCFDRRFIQSNLLLETMSTMEFLGVSGLVKFEPNKTDRINGSYYYVQNIQNSSSGVSFVPVLRYSDSSDWTFFPKVQTIIWPNHSSVVPFDRATLKGLQVRIGIIESKPFTMRAYAGDLIPKKSEQFSGYIPDLIELLRNNIGFIPIIKLVPSNETYGGLIQAVIDDKFDIVMGDITITAARKEMVDFSDAIFDNSLCIIMRKTPQISLDLLSFLNTFSLNLWLSILVTLIVVGLLVCLVERNDNMALQHRSIPSQMLMCVWYSFGNLVGYGVDFDVQTAAGRLLTSGLYMLSLILVATFTANLASDFTLSKTRSIISGLDDIKNGKIPMNRIGVSADTAIEDYVVREITSGNIVYYRGTSQYELYDRLLDGTVDAVIMDTSTGEYIVNNIYCNLTLISDGFDKGAFAAVTKKQWLYKKDLDINILRLRESGKLEQLKIKWFETKNCPVAQEIPTSRSIESMRGLFLTVGIICALSLFVFIWSIRHTIRQFICGCYDHTKVAIYEK